LTRWDKTHFTIHHSKNIQIKDLCDEGTMLKHILEKIKAEKDQVFYDDVAFK